MCSFCEVASSINFLRYVIRMGGGEEACGTWISSELQCFGHSEPFACLLKWGIARCALEAYATQQRDCELMYSLGLRAGGHAIS